MCLALAIKEFSNEEIRFDIEHFVGLQHRNLCPNEPKQANGQVYYFRHQRWREYAEDVVFQESRLDAPASILCFHPDGRFVC